MSSENAEIIVGAKDMASRVLEGVSTKLNGIASSASSMMPVFAGVAAGVASVGAAFAVVGTAAAAVKNAADQIDAMNDKAAGLGESVGNLQAFQFAMEEAGNIDGEKSIQALQKIRKAVGEAASGGATASVFEKLKLDAEALTMKGPVDQFKAVQAALGGIENSTERAKLAQELLGKSAADLLPALQVNAEAFAESEDAARRFGLAVSDEQAAAIGQMNDALGRAQMAFQGMLNQVAGDLAPVINMVLADLQKFAPAFDAFLAGIEPGIAYMTQFAMTMRDVSEAWLAMQRFDFSKAVSFASGQDSIDNVLKYAEARRQAGLDAQEAARKREEERKAAFQSEKQDLEALAQAERDRAAAAAETKAAQEYDKTIEALEKQLTVLQLGADEVKRQEELAKARNDAERERIALLQEQIQLAQQEATAKKQAEDEANKLAQEIQKEQDRIAKEEADKQAKLQAPTDPIQAFESRLLTRGTGQNDPTKEVADNTKKLIELQQKQNEIMSRWKFEKDEKTQKFVVVGG